MANVLNILEERGFVDAVTSEELREKLNSPLKVYCGFDPTGDSLHLGHMVAIMGLAWFQRCGHTPIALVGGATGMIGDPSGRSSERSILDEATIKQNVIGIQKNLETVLDSINPTTKPIYLNNYDWFKTFSFIDFLRDVGKYFRIGTMLAKDSVRSRMASEEGISFTEFSYQLLQSYDFFYLNEKYDITLQIGGSDQWGNITAGCELVRKMSGNSVYGVTFPLMTRSDGQKFGKSEKGAIWLSPEKLAPYEFYQYLVRVSDQDVITLMKLLTFMEMSEIHHYQTLMQKSDYTPNTAQKRLAEEVTRIVHGDSGLNIALKVTQGVAPGAETVLDSATLEAIAGDMPSKTVAIDDIMGLQFVDVLVKIGLQNSKGEARRLLRNGGFYLNNQKIENESAVLQLKDLIDGHLLLLSVGKKNKLLVRVNA
ncbi:MAG: tyrosine--tRNA ligase [Parachlamydiaceae bacterium]|nr:tyrosine--tRNA ligase [Parachlamydiaceae bacterium]